MDRTNIPRRRRRLTAMLMASVLLTSSLSGAVAGGDPGGFRDVPDDSRHANHIYALTETGVISGYPDGTFRPANQVKRGPLATMMVNGFELDAVPDTERFSDVTGTAHATAIGVLASIGAVEGYPDGTYRPYAPVTRAEAAAIFGRVLDARPLGGQRFRDVPEGTTHAGFINAMHQRDVIDGYEDGTFRPDEGIRRDQFASMLYRAIHSQGIGADLPEQTRYVAREIATMAEADDLDGLARLALQGPVEQPRGTPGMGFTASFDQEVSTPEELVALWEEIGRDEVLETLIALVDLPDWYPATGSDVADEPITIYVTPRFMHEPTPGNRALLEEQLGADVVEASISDCQWLGWRLGITAEGEWLFFVTGSE
jgi:hypothetical protein